MVASSLFCNSKIQFTGWKIVSKKCLSRNCFLNELVTFSWTDFDIFLLIKHSLWTSCEFKSASSGISFGITVDVGRVTDFADFDRVFKTGFICVACDTSASWSSLGSCSWNVTAIEWRFQRSFSERSKPTSTAISRGKHEKLMPAGLRMGMLSQCVICVGLRECLPASQVKLTRVVPRIFR